MKQGGTLALLILKTKNTEYQIRPIGHIMCFENPYVHESLRLTKMPYTIKSPPDFTKSLYTQTPYSKKHIVMYYYSIIFYHNNNNNNNNNISLSLSTYIYIYNLLKHKLLQ